MTRLHPDLDDDDLQDLSRQLHDLADRWEVAPPAERPDLAAGRASRRPAWRPSWLGTGMAPVLAGLALVALAVAASVWLSTLSDEPDVVERDGAGAGASELLDEIPAEIVGDGPVVVSIGDLEAATDLLGGERPDLSSPAEEVQAWINGISGLDEDAGPEAVGSGVAHVQLPDQPYEWMRVQGWDDQLGWSLLDVDRYVDVDGGATLGMGGNVDLLDGITVVTGPATDVAYPDDATKVGDDVVRVGEVGCGLDDSAPPVRLQGCPLYLAHGDDRLLLASTPAQVEAWRDDAPTLADDGDLDAVLDALGQDWVTAQLIRADFALGDLSNPQLDDGDVLPEPFELAGLSWSRDDAGPVVTVAYLHGDAEAAAGNAEDLERVWSGPAAMQQSLPDLVSVEDVRTDDRLATVTLRPVSDQGNAAAFTEADFGGAPFQYASGVVGIADGSAAGDVEPSGFEQWTNDLPFDAGEVLSAQESLPDRGAVDAGAHLGDWGLLSDGPDPLEVTVHATCQGRGEAGIDFDDATVEPSAAFPCDGSTMTIERTLPNGDVRVGLFATQDDTRAEDAWLAWVIQEDDQAPRGD